MITKQTVNLLKALFGDTVGPPPEGTMFAYSFDTLDPEAGAKAKETLERSQLFSSVDIEQELGTVTVKVPYKEWKSAQDWRSQSSAPATLIESMLYAKQHDNCSITVPLSEEMSAFLTNHLSRMNREFEFLVPIRNYGDQIQFSIPQFQTVRNTWQMHAKSNEVLHGLTASSDEERREGPKGSAKPEEDELGDKRIDLAVGVTGTLGLTDEEAMVVLGLRLPEENGATAEKDEEKDNGLSDPAEWLIKDDPDTYVKDSTPDGEKGVDGPEADNVVKGPWSK